MKAYIIQTDSSTFCKDCGKPVDLLCREDGPTKKNPAFYICSMPS